MFAQSKNALLNLLLIICLVFLWGCSAPRNDLLKEALVAKHDVSQKKIQEISEINTMVFSSAQMSVDPSDYLLGPGDLLEVTVFESKDLGAEVRVSSRGYVTLPLLGQVLVKDLSAREAEEKIEGLYKQKYIKDPHISIFVKEHFSQRVVVIGEVKSPGTYDFPTKQRLIDVLALAGGLTDKAGVTIQVRRIGSQAQGERGSFIVDLDKLVKEGKTELNIEINGGDVIFVPEAGSYFVDGAIRRPGSYLIKHRMVIRDALLAAGGLAPYAKKEGLALIRYGEDGQREVIEIDLEKNPEKLEIAVEDRDVIIIEGSGWGKFVHGTGVSVGFPGFLGFTYKDPEK